METVAISKFKAQCLAILERVRRTGQPVLVTRFGEPVAEIVPPQAQQLVEGWLGRYRSLGRIVGDIVSPVAEESEWEALKR
jgi:prevent-host-death family protein